MKIKNLNYLASLMAATLAGSSAFGAVIVSDNFNTVNSGSGFALGSGVNSGINPPTTRLTGTSAANLRYLYTQTTTPKATSSFTIGSNKLKVAAAANSGRFTLSADGTTPFDFASALGVTSATTNNPVVYEIGINMDNDSAGIQRFSLGLGTVESDATTWDFGIQLYRAVATDTTYTVQKRIDTASAGVADVNLPMYSNAGTFGTELSFLIRVTDAGPETTTFSSRVQVYQIVGGVTNAVYDTLGDTDLPNGFRLDGGSRFIMWDIASQAAATYENFYVNLVSTPTVQTRVWTGGGADDNWSNGANWGGTAPGTGDILVFNGATRQANVNDIVGLLVPSVTFSNGGFALSGNSWALSSAITNLAGVNTFNGDLAWSATFAKAWNLASGTELVLNNTNTVEVNGDHTISGGGTLRLKGLMNIGQATTATPAIILNEGNHIIEGGTLNSRGGYRIGSLATGAGGQLILTNGATFALTALGANMRVGDSSNPNTNRLIINNSTLTMAGASIGIPYAAGATSEVTQVGGRVSGAIMNFNQNGVGQGIYTIQNGTLETLQIKKNTSGGTCRITFDNAILRPSGGASNAFFTGLNLADIQAGGLAIDASSDVTIGQALSGVGALVKSNFATVTLTGANTYVGDTFVQSGKLVFGMSQSNATTVQVADGAEFGVAVPAAGKSVSVSGLNFNGASFGTLSFDLGSFSTPTAPLLKLSNLSVSGPVTINVANGLQLGIGQIVLVDYSGVIAGGFQFTLGSLPPGVTANLVDNTANSSIDLNITGVPGFLWTGAISGDWDNSTQNWIDKQLGSPSTYADGLPVEFLDGASNAIVSLITFPSPSAISVSNNTLPYVWSGGAITAPILKKFGAASLTRAGGEADLITGIELNAGAYIVTNGFDATFATILTDVSGGTGTFVKRGGTKLTITSTNSTYDGAFLIQEGTIKITADRALGATTGSTTISNGATLDLNDFSPGAEPVFVSGAGVGGAGAIIDTTTGGAVDTNLRDVTMTGDTTFGAPNGGRWDIRVRTSTGTGPGLKGNGFKLTKVGSGFVSIAAQRNLGASTPYWQMNLGDILISQGTLALAESISLGNPSASLTIASGANLQIYDLGLTNPIVRNITMASGAKITVSGAAGDTNVINGAIQLTGATSIFADSAALIVNGAMTGSGGSVTFSVNSPGTLILNGVNTYTGDTIISNGTLAGIGVIAGQLIMNGGTNSPGYAGIGTLTVNGNVTLGGVTVMELNRSLSPNSDRLVAGGALAFGGTLNVVLAAGAPAPQSGDVYQLFNKAGSGSFSAINLPTLTGGRSWDTSGLSVNGSIKVVGGATPPTIGNVYAEGNNLILSGTGGVAGANYYVLSSTNVGAPLASWIPVATNTFGPGGSFNYTNSINPATPARFFLLQVP